MTSTGLGGRVQCAKCTSPLAPTDHYCPSCGFPVGTDGDSTTSSGGTPQVWRADGHYHDPITGRVLSSWGRRVGAWVIDDLILAIPGFIVRAPLGSPVTTTSNPCEGGLFVCRTAHLHVGVLLEGLLASGLLFLVYYALLTGLWRGQTFGMMAVGICVRDAASDVRIGLGRSLLRTLVILALGWVLIIPVLIDFASPLWDRRRQAWHDHAARSIVVFVTRSFT